MSPYYRISFFSFLKGFYLDGDSYHGKVDIGGVQFQVDLAVDASLAVLVVILSHLRAHVAACVETHEKEREKTLENSTHYTVQHFNSSWS